MSGRTSAYGFLGRYPGDVRRERYLMPASVHSPLRGFQLRSIVVWPDVFSEDGLLLSLKVQSREGPWKERLISPEPLRRYTPSVNYETALSACVPPEMRGPGSGVRGPVRSGSDTGNRCPAPGSRFIEFVGEAPLSCDALAPSSEAFVALSGTPMGPVSVGWSGALRGLLLVGSLH